MGEEPVAPAGFIELGFAETLRAGDAFEIERDFGVGGGDFELDGIVAVVLRALVGSNLEPVVTGVVIEVVC